MKYVILQPRPDAKAMMRILACCAPMTHEQLAAPYAATHAPKSAGFFEIAPGGAVRTFGHSDSLQLGPGPHDAALLDSFIRATVAQGAEIPVA